MNLTRYVVAGDLRAGDLIFSRLGGKIVVLDTFAMPHIDGRVLVSWVEFDGSNLSSVRTFSTWARPRDIFVQGHREGA